MGKKRLLTGIVLGAVVGGLTALINKETRTYTKNKIQTTTNQTKYYLKHPSQAVRNIKGSVEQFNEKLEKQATNAINALEQIEKTLDQVREKDS